MNKELHCFYPKNPVGLRWDAQSDHYLMADQIFFAYQHNGAQPPRTQPEKEEKPPRLVRGPFHHARGGRRIA